MKNKYAFRSISLLALSILSINFFSCLDSEGGKEKNTRLLTADEWHISSVTNDGDDITELFSGMILSFTKETYTATDGEPIWLSGHWSFVGDFTEQDVKTIVRDDDVLVTIETLTKNNLTLIVDWNADLLEGRSNSIQGELVFKFTH
jgi:hypothetical protein